MALSPNYGWSEPDNSSLVKNGAADIRTLGDAIDASLWNVGFGQAGKNRIINGDFNIWQRGSSFTPTGSTTYTVDRGQCYWNGTPTITISRQAFTAGTAPVAGYESQYFYRFAQTVAGSGMSYCSAYMQPIEDVRTFAGQTITISFWAKADSARVIQSYPYQQFGSGGSSAVFPATNLTATLSASWARYSFTYAVPSVAGKTIGTGSNLAISIEPTALNTAQTIDIWGVQVEYGSKATPFETATGTIQGELAACQRYYERINAIGNGINISSFGQALSTTVVDFPVSFAVNKRTTPTSIDTSGVSIYRTIVGSTVTGGTITMNNSTSPYIGWIRFTNGTAVFTLGEIDIPLWQTNGYIGFSAEL